MKKALAAALLFSVPLWGEIAPNLSASGNSAYLLDRLEALGCAFPTARALGPLSFVDAVKAVDWDPEVVACAAPAWLLDERQLILRPNPAPEIQTHGFFGRGDAVTLAGIPATIWPLSPARSGRLTYDGFSLGTELSISGRGGREPWGVALGVVPGMFFGVDTTGFSAVRFYLQEAQLKLGYGQVELVFGRYARRFGTTRHGSLLYSQASAPLDTLEFVVRPTTPGRFKTLGPVTFRTWAANQGGGAAVRDTWLWGVELGLRPFHWWEFAVAELFQFGGVGAPALSVGEGLTQIFGGGGSALSGRRNASLALHTAFWLPDRQTQIYGQVLWNRLGDAVPTPYSTLAGLWFPKLGKWDLRLELVETGPDSYTHPVWTQGLTYRGTPLGHVLGPDGLGFYVDLGLPPIATWWHGELGFLYEARRRNPGGAQSTETRYGASLSGGRRWRRIDVQAQLAMHHLEGAQYVIGSTANVWGITLLGRYTFF